MKKLVLLAGAALLLAGCCNWLSPAGTGWISPGEAVLLAAEAAPQAVPGTFAMTVRGVGARRDEIFLNSEADYRDQRNLTVVLTAPAASVLARRLEADPQAALLGKEILVRGQAERVLIHFIVQGQATESYYYQTHVAVTDADQVVIR